MSRSYEIIGSITVNPSLLRKEIHKNKVLGTTHAECLNPQEKILKVTK